MQKRLTDNVAFKLVENATQLADGANALSAYTRKMGDSLAFAIALKYTADGDATYAISLTECDTVGGSYTAVASAEQSGNGTYTQAQLAALGQPNCPILNYLGGKKFIKVNITTANITDNVNTVYSRATVLAIESGCKLQSAGM